MVLELNYLEVKDYTDHLKNLKASENLNGGGRFNYVIKRVTCPCDRQCNYCRGCLFKKKRIFLNKSA